MAKEEMLRYAYFLKTEELPAATEALKALGLKVKQVHGLPCLALKLVKRTAFIAGPETWNGLCYRQGCWYRASDKVGQHLLVTPLPLLGRRGVKITESDFEPQSLPTEDEIKTLASLPGYLKTKPDEWDKVSPEEIRKLAQFSGRGSAADSEEALAADFAKLFVYHCANHANFIEPRFYANENGGIAPHSIAPTDQVCSACAELFNILAAEYKVKYVVACPGSVTYAGLPADCFLRVEECAE